MTANPEARTPAQARGQGAGKPHALEERHSAPEPAGRTFTRDEIRSALAGNVQQAGTLSPLDERYLLALAEVLDPGPFGGRT